MNKGKSIIIVSFYNTSGGSLVLNYLCNLLNESGYDAKIYLFKYPMTSNDYSALKFFINHLDVSIRYFLKNKIPVLTKILPTRFHRIEYFNKIKIKFFPFFKRDETIVIYPEIVYGNPLKAKNVVRWLLYFNRYQNDLSAYSKNDLFIAYRKIFNDPFLNPEELTVTINYFDSDLYKQFNYGKREGNCYIIRKGKSRDDLPSEFDGPIFDNNMTDKEFVDILNRCKYCYCYDTQTFYTSIAAICGCIPIVVLEKGKNRHDYLSEEDKVYGIAYGDSQEEIDYAINTRSQLIKSLDFRDSNLTNLNRLIKILQNKFGKLSKR